MTADVILIAADCYLRKSDWRLIRHEDVVVDPVLGVAVLLGVAERGEATKTGTRQGVRPDRPGVAALLLKYKGRCAEGQRIFQDLPLYKFDSIWREAREALQYDAGPAHTLRHVGPSADVAGGYRTLDQIRVRGRWRAKTSVLRYAKSHSLVAATARLPNHLRQRGGNFLLRLGVELHRLQWHLE